MHHTDGAAERPAEEGGKRCQNKHRVSALVAPARPQG